MKTIGEIGRTDEELRIFSVEDGMKRRHSVSLKFEPHTRKNRACLFTD